jgi:hypothetical protein
MNTNKNQTLKTTPSQSNIPEQKYINVCFNHQNKLATYIIL